MKKTFKNNKIICSNRQPPSLGSMLIRSRFDLEPRTLPSNSDAIVGLSVCSKCKYCRSGYLVACKSITFGKYNEYTWYYTRNFSCESRNVHYLLICGYCWKYYIGHTNNTKKRTRKHKSDVLHPGNSLCKKLSKHLRECSNLRSPYFQIYPFYYEDNVSRRRYLEKRLIQRYDPPLNEDA